jgi:hypothetical protein
MSILTNAINILSYITPSFSPIPIPTHNFNSIPNKSINTPALQEQCKPLQPIAQNCLLGRWSSTPNLKNPATNPLLSLEAVAEVMSAAATTPLA